MNGFTVQLKVPSSIKPTSIGEMVVFEFELGPIHVACLVNIPHEGETESTTYVKIDLRPSKTEWTIWKDKEND